MATYSYFLSEHPQTSHCVADPGWTHACPKYNTAIWLQLLRGAVAPDMSLYHRPGLVYRIRMAAVRHLLHNIPVYLTHEAEKLL
jgi:hypothetical protein